MTKTRKSQKQLFDRNGRCDVETLERLLGWERTIRYV